MARRFINQFTHQEPIDQIFLAQQKQLRPNRNGNTYLQVELSDRSGIISGRMWNAGDGEYRGFNDGDFVRVEGLAQLFQGQMQLIIHNICRARMDEVNEDDFMPLSPATIDQLVARLIEILRSIKNPQLRSLADCFVMDETFMAKFARAPAGVKNHHAYVGGLLEHVVNLMEVILLVTRRYPELDAELMLIGALTHDMGKIDELAYDKGFSYTDEGQLIGHLVMAVSTVERKAAEAQKLTGEAIAEETLLRIKHMIISHHGEYEYGSPKLPMTLEAIALHQLDNLDAKIHSFGQLMREDPNVESHWTAYQASLGRKLFKGGK